MSPSLCFLQHLLSNKHGWWWPYKKCSTALEMLCHGRIPIGACSRAKSGKSEQRFSYKWWKFKNATACWQRIWKMLNKLAVHCLGLNPWKVINKIVLGGRYWVIPIYSQGKTPLPALNMLILYSSSDHLIMINSWLLKQLLPGYWITDEENRCYPNSSLPGNFWYQSINFSANAPCLS